VEPSPNGFTIPDDGSQLRGPDLAVWTFQGGTPAPGSPLPIHKDGAWWHWGEGFKVKVWNGVIYAQAGDGWWKDGTEFWTFFGTTDPEDVGQPPPTEIVQTTGSITANQNTLTVADRTDFAEGDWIIVEIGKEPGLGQRGTRGVGDQWPSFSAGVASLAAAIATHGTNPSGNVYVWINDTNSGEYGYVYWGRSVGWIWLGDLNWGAVTQTGDYYAALRTPRSLQAQIQTITPGSGTTGTFTLHNGPTSGLAKVTVTDATVYRDEIVEINNALASGNLQLTAGDHIVGGVIHITNETDRVLEGATTDRAATRIITPKGVPCAAIDIHNSPGTVIKNLTLQGNWRDHGFGHNYGDGPSAQAEINRGEPACSDSYYSVSVGIRAVQGSTNTVFQNVATVDLAVAHFGTRLSNNVTAVGCDTRYTDPLRQYMQWAYYWTDTTGGGCTDCTTSGAYMYPGWESFKSSGVSFINCSGIGTWSMNGSQLWLIQDCSGTYPANSCVNTPTGINRDQPIVNINNNINMPAAFLSPGGHIDGLTLNQQGYIQNGNTSMACALKVMDSCPNVLAEGFENICPNYVPGAPHQGAQAIDSAGANFIVRNSTFRGKAYWTPQNAAAHKAVLYVRNHNVGACTGLSLPDDPNSKFYF
jgi:hypothetical protein